ncbi:MAG: lytic transglycosylase domain-containing protein [Parvibaculum sp.]|nr:lytic transglycosylase domain-containing protein [Parvibaculum sp.]
MSDRTSVSRDVISKPRLDRTPRRTFAKSRLLALSLALGLVFALPPEGYAATSSAPTPTAKPAASTAKAEATPKKKTTTKKAAKKKTKKEVAAAKPKPAPALPITSAILSANDISALKDALAEADRGHWSEAMRHRLRITNKPVQKFILWYRLVNKDSGATLAEITAFQEKNPAWPRIATLKRRAEEALLRQSPSQKDVLTWFVTHPPQTGEGKIAYGKALMASGNAKDGKSWIQRAWAENDFSSSRQREIINTYRAQITPAVHKERLDRLLWDRSTADARYTASLIGSNATHLAEARIRLMTRSSAARDAVDRVPSALRGDAGLLFDRIRYERKAGNDQATVPLILTAPGLPHQMVAPDAWWLERKIAARVALANGQYQDAYTIVSKHGLKDGSDFADAEFMSGWIALQFLNKPDIALTHFKKLKNAVSTPISTARADYWMGRSASAKGDKQNAEVYYRLASNNPTTFYGQLGSAALAHLKGGEAILKLPAEPKPTAAQKAEFKKNELVIVSQVLNDFHRDVQKWSFMLHLADTLQTSHELVLLSDLALQFGDPKLSLRVAKTAAQRNFLLPQRAYPTKYMPAYMIKGPQVERALVYGLSRQESEFDPEAQSPVGARGLMQLMPATARATARQIDVPYSLPRLTSDPAYNAMLGSAHLGDLIEGYDGSYIMSIAAYNAGASRVSEWRGDYGDPRSTIIDPIDWIENIPFSETRNYVQRVIENMEVYRTQLSTTPQKIRISDDIRRNTGAPISTPAPKPGQTPLAAPAPSMAPVIEQVETDPSVRAPLAPVRRQQAKP